MALDNFLVCGLGSLGQNCVIALKEFGVRTIAIEQNQAPQWETVNLPQIIDLLIIGDCRDRNTLIRAEIDGCRAALIVTTNEKANAETAIAIRQLNPLTRLVVRSAKENLNKLLSEQLGNFIAYEPTHLPADAFALSALGRETLGLFSLDGHRFRIGQVRLSQNHHWCHTRLLYELNTRTRRIIAHSRENEPPGASFYRWEPEGQVLPGDTLVYIETEAHFLLDSFSGTKRKAKQRENLFRAIFQQKKPLSRYLAKFWQLNFEQQIRRVAFFSALIVLILLSVGTIFFQKYYPGTTLLSSFYVTTVLLLGDYSELFGSFEPIEDFVPQWLQLFALGLTLAGTAFVGVLYALLTQALLSSKFQFTNKRPPIPQEDHIVIIGFGRVGQRVAILLRQFKQPVLAVTFNSNFDRSILPEMPLIVGNMEESLAQANLATAKSIVVATDDDILNLEVALMAKNVNPEGNLTIRTSGKSLTENLSNLLPEAEIIDAYQVAAEAFAGAAFGENIVYLFRLQNQTILATEYRIEAGDTLNGLLLSEVAYGYGVMPIYYVSSQLTPILMPSDDVKLAIGDRLVVLGTIEGLRRIEKGSLAKKTWYLHLEGVASEDAAFEGANIVARISGCSLAIARELMDDVPNTLAVPLYRHQGIRLVRALKKNLVYGNLSKG